ncbi:esterase-like [Vitis riparia]|uniref:Esterase n=1 Tax=Vitis vinifera TaxID=29760 RepID=A0A438C393_VITVI|nr:esterase-like [Vitis riparia]RVW17705.1 Esterase [Vitis vinifera]
MRLELTARLLRSCLSDFMQPYLTAKITRFEHSLVACCGYGGKYNYNNEVVCGGTITVNGTDIFIGACDRPWVRANWDGIHYTEAANKFVFDRISSGAYTDPPVPLKMACHRRDSR